MKKKFKYKQIEVWSAAVVRFKLNAVVTFLLYLKFKNNKIANVIKR